ncbi:hypothetical protein SAMN04488556_4261 [Halostagnicola kamekurae]|uniref:Uncharacterized protein n=1 Tax=Halostagnicola kamekurae TaxID=619731 RepID=A0A1I6V1W9_9EURY|nr:hypothetical protein SAMN04488556_4261 [Halostagnicola kamekurae]
MIREIGLLKAHLRQYLYYFAQEIECFTVGFL